MYQGIQKLSLVFISILIFLGGFFVFQPKMALAAAGINKQVNFQGKVVNADGTNVTNGSYNFLFCIYTTGSPATACTAGALGSALWKESKSITVTDGIFQTNLGDTDTTLGSVVDFNTDNIYLGMNFNSNGQMTPLVQFTASPYAFNSDNLDGKDWTNPGTIGTSATTLALASGGTSTWTNTSGGLTISTATSGTLALTSAGALNFSGAGASYFNTSAGNISFQVAGTGTSGTLQVGGGGAGSVTPDFFGLDVKSSTGDPTGGFEGAMYYNTYDNKFRCYQGSAWADCGMSIGGAITTATAGSILYAGASGNLAQDNSNFYYDYTNHYLGLGTTTPAGIFDVRGGTATSGNGTSINVYAQNGFGTGNTNGGNIILMPGTANGSGTAGGVGIGLTPGTNRLLVYGNVASGGTIPTALASFISQTATYGTTNESNAVIQIEGRNGSNDRTVSLGIGVPSVYGGHDSGFLNFGSGGIWAADGGTLKFSTTPGTSYQGNTYKGFEFYNGASDNQDAYTFYSSVPTFNGTAMRVVVAATGGSGNLMSLESAQGGRFIVKNSGNVGIGTASPVANFQIAQPTTGPGTVSVSGTAVTGVGTQFTNTFKVGDNITVTTTSGSETKAITTVTSDTALVTAAFTGTASAGTAYTLVGGSRFAVLGNGNVGIGTTAPLAEFHVKSARTTGFSPFFQIEGGKAGGNAASVAYTRLNSTQQTLFAFETGNSANPDGYIGTMPNITNRLFTITSNGSNGFAIDNTYGFAIGTNAQLVDSTYTGATTKFDLSGNGYFAANLSIGTTSTAGKLSVENTNTSGTAGEYINNSIATGTLTDGLKIEQTGAGTMTNAIEILKTAGTIGTGLNIGNGVTTGISIGTGATTGISIASGGITISGGALAINNATGITSNQSTMIINASGTVDVQDILNADSVTSDAGVSIANNQTYTGAGIVNISSAAGSALNIDSGTVGGLNIGTDSSAETISIATGAAAKALTIGSTNTTSSTIIQSGTGSIKLQGTGGTISAPNVIQIGAGGAGSTNPDVFSLDTKTLTGDPTAAGTPNGSMYYNVGDGKFRCLENGVWVNCITASTATNPGGATTQIQFNDGGSFGGDADFAWDKTGNALSLGGVDTGIILNGITNEPATPATGNLRVYSKSIAGRMLPKWLAPSGVDTSFQSSLGFNRIATVTPAGGTTLATAVAGYATAFTNVGTVANPSPAGTNALTSTRRVTFSTGASAGALASHRQATTMVWRGNSVAYAPGGFFFTMRFGTSTLASGNRAFVGLSDTITAPTNVDPTTSTAGGKVGLAINASTGNWNFIQNVAGSAPVVTGLGTSFPVNNTALYELVLYSKPNDTVINYRVTNLSTGAQVTGNTGAFAPNFGRFGGEKCLR